MRACWTLIPVVVGAVTWGAAVPSAHAQGTLKVALSANLNTLDPAKAKSGDEHVVNFLVYSGLTEVDDAGKVHPDLAESWTGSDDLKTWTFKLRPGVKFHDGRPVDAEDVKTTIERIRDPAIGSVARANFAIVDSIDVVDPQTIRFNLKLAYAGFAELFADRQVKIVPRDHLDTIATSPDGTGPFRFKSYRPGDRIELVRNNDYFHKGEPRLDGVLLRIMPEAASRMSAVKTGEIDLVWDLPLETVADLQKDRNIAVDMVATSSWDGLIMNAAQKPFDNVKVRAAIQAAIDKKAMVEIALFGNGTATHTMIPPTSAYYNGDIPIPAGDAGLAKKLLAEAGFPNGFTVTLYVPASRPARERLGLAAKEMLAPAGINVDLQRVPWDKFISDIEGKAGFYADGFYSRPTVDTATYPFYDSAGSWNATLWNYKNPEIDALLDRARATASEEERIKLYKQFQAIVLQSPAGVIPYVLNHANAVRRNVRDFHSSPFMWLDLRKTTIQ